MFAWSRKRMCVCEREEGAGGGGGRERERERLVRVLVCSSVPKVVSLIMKHLDCALAATEFDVVPEIADNILQPDLVSHSGNRIAPQTHKCQKVVTEFHQKPTSATKWWQNFTTNTSATKWRKEEWRKEAADIPPSKAENDLCSTRQILALFRGQPWGDCWETGRSAYGPFRALRCSLEVKLKTETESGDNFDTNPQVPQGGDRISPQTHTCHWWQSFTTNTQVPQCGDKITTNTQVP